MKRQLYIYSSLFITLALNIPKLFTLRENTPLAHFVPFNLSEVIFQTCLNLIFCFIIFFISDTLKITKVFTHLVNLIVLMIFFTIGLTIQKNLYGAGYFLPGRGLGIKLILTVILVLIEVRIVDILRQARQKELENDRLRNAHLKAELGLLKGQLQPHFFFNALSSLSGVVREDPAKAQYYINQLSRFFRYSLQKEDTGLVDLKEEISAVNSYAALLKMRHEEGFQLIIDIPEDQQHRRLPHMSLQPLVENAVKHNKLPLVLEISLQEKYLIVKNNLQPVHFPEPGTGIGLANLNERYKILLQQEISINKTSTAFIVKLPLQ
ncbi:sensor histidine kinase [Chitinophaga sancti]|uniref:Histidine kinase n=1 Tax=Chitinophaga sancti TaxID=1004 RepID=A0A1K1RPP8_9BACT|nr:histidine kinase [Chitinophaga sancti]WQD62505.1 histidine kinase [Chitinophaga sancti]WQG91926.1 histidine kinase [Chitinophaga sancti]SFW74251.1 Histidine kinase [Chitinophaga sancti]